MDVTLPNGVVIRNVPEGTPKSAIAFKAIISGLAKPEDFGQESLSRSPTEGMSGFDKFRAGYGKSAVDLGRGIAQHGRAALGPVGLLLPGVTNEQVAESRRLDAPLMETGAGKAGYIGGAIANTLPAAAIPGANTMAGSAAIGAGLGMLQPSTGAGETATNIAVGGALGPAALAAGRGVAAGYQSGKALIEPFTRGGQERIAARTLQAFAGGEKEAARAAQNIEAGLQQPMLPGVQPTTAELAMNPGVAQLERTVKNNPEVLTALTDRTQANRGAMVTALDQIAGTPQQSQAASTIRSAATKPLYEAADSMVVKVDSTLRRLLARPSMQKALARASDLAQESGHKLDVTGETFSGRTLHFLKMAMDDLTDNPQVSGIGANEVNAIRSTKGSLLEWMEQKLPTYGMGRKLFSYLSKPINQMQIGQALRDKLVPALGDFGATTRSRGEVFARALREGDEFAARTLGRGSADMSAIMSPRQMQKLRMIGEQLARRTNADELGRAVGSNTGQNMVSQNVLRQLLGPLGLPESTIQRAAESTLMQSIMRPVQFAGKIGEDRVLQVLAKAALNPVMAKELLRVGINPMQIGLLLRNQQFLAPALVSGTNAARQ